MRYDFLVVAALPQESFGRFERLNYPICYTGVGKLNAMHALIREISSLQKRRIYPKAVINLGTVGSFVYEPNRVLQVEKFIERDMLCEPLAPKYHVPFNGGGPIKMPFYTNAFESVTCGTGDSFSNLTTLQRDSKDYQIADMEGYALAKTCLGLKLPFISLKCVSDSGNTKDWEKNLETTSNLLFQESSKLFLELKKTFF